MLYQTGQRGKPGLLQNERPVSGGEEKTHTYTELTQSNERTCSEHRLRAGSVLTTLHGAPLAVTLPYWFSGAALTTWVAKQQEFIPQGFEGEKAEIKVSAGQAPPKPPEKSLSFLSHNFWWLSAMLGVPWLTDPSLWPPPPSRPRGIRHAGVCLQLSSYEDVSSSLIASSYFQIRSHALIFQVAMNVEGLLNPVRLLF